METAIKEYIEQNIPELKGKIHPVFTTKLDGVRVAYIFTPISGGHLKQCQMELKIIGSDYEECKEMEGKINKLLDMEEDMPLVVTGGIRFHSEVAGGGILFNDECRKWENNLHYIMKWRKTNVI